MVEATNEKNPKVEPLKINKEDILKKEPFTKSKKVAIIGSASSTLGLTPWQDPNIELWTLAWRTDVRSDLAFDIHKLGPQRRRVPENYEQFLANKGCPVVMQEKLPPIVNSVRYPIEAVIKAIGVEKDPYANGDYFQSSIAYMLALAIYKQYEEIHMYGVDLITTEEYGDQKPNAEYLIGMARGMGIRVFIPENAALVKSIYRYGYDEGPNLGPLTEPVIMDRVRQYDDKFNEAHAAMLTADGARQEARQMLAIVCHWQRGGEAPEPMEPHEREAMKVEMAKRAAIEGKQ